MSEQYWDCIQFKKTKNDKTFAVRIGSAKKNDDGGFELFLDALPMPNGDGCRLSIKPRRDKADGGKSSDAPF